MTETYHPRMTAERWLALLEEEVRSHAVPVAEFPLDDIEALLQAAEERSRPRTVLPPQLNRPPFTWFRAVPVLLLKSFKFLFNDQRAVNNTLIQALRETLTVNRYLLTRLAAVEHGGVAGAESAKPRLDTPSRGFADSAPATRDEPQRRNAS